jgi:calcium-dependent protein kinase
MRQSRDAKIPQKIVNLAFENKFEVLRTPVDEKKGVGTALGIRIELEGSKHVVQYMSSNQDLLKRWREFLSARINQRKFHESFKAHRKIGKGNFASVKE